MGTLCLTLESFGAMASKGYWAGKASVISAPVASQTLLCPHYARIMPADILKLALQRRAYAADPLYSIH
jgi:hypothetical protein